MSRKPQVLKVTTGPPQEVTREDVWQVPLGLPLYPPHVGKGQGIDGRAEGQGWGHRRKEAGFVAGGVRIDFHSRKISPRIH